MSNTIKFDLIQNAIDSLDFAVDLLAYKSEIDESTLNKRAILAISHAIELLLKERLRRKHPSLVWENVDKYLSLESKTVTADGALNRLQKIGGLVFNEGDQKLLRSIKKTRNAIEHYTWSISSNEAEYIVGTSLSFAVSFMKEHLDYDFIGYAERDGGTLSDLISKNKAFAKSYKKRSACANVTSTNNSTKCFFCKALMNENDDGVCSKCGHWHSEAYASYDGEFDDDIPF